MMRLVRNPPAGLLVATVLCLAAGAALHWAGRTGTAGDGLWMAAGAIGAAYSLCMTGLSLRSGRVGVDVIALLALVGALAVGEYLAAGVIAVMVTSGRALEGWAEGRAHRDLGALLARAPSFAHLHEDGRLTTVPVERLAVGDVVSVRSPGGPAPLPPGRDVQTRSVRNGPVIDAW